MLIQQPAQVSHIYRWSYMFGRMAKRGQRKLAAYQCRTIESPMEMQLPTGQLMTRIVWIIAKLAVIAGLVVLAAWLITFIIMMLAFSALLGFKALVVSNNLDIYSSADYMGADLYIDDFDDNGHYIGDSKSSNGGFNRT
jgi:hypothetical protein